MITKALTTEQVATETQMSQLLNAEQKTICEHIAIGETLDSRRARALLIVNDGATQAEAGQQVGLTLYQVKYCLTRFRKLGVAMFPAVPPAATQPNPDLDPKPVPKPEPFANAGAAQTVVAKPINKTGNKVSKGKKNNMKKKNKAKQARGQKKGKEAKLGRSTKKSHEKKDAKKGKKKSRDSRKKDTGGKKGRNAKSSRSSRKKGKR